MKIRLLGAFVLFAIAAIFLPMIFSGKSPTTGGDQTLSLAIPDSPDRDLQTRTMSLTPDAPAGSASAAAPARASSGAGASTSVIPGAGDRLATVDIGSSRPRDVQADPGVAGKPVPTAVTTGSGASPSQPVIPLQGKAAVRAVAMAPKAGAASPPRAAVTPSTYPASTGSGSYSLNLSAYASAAGAASLERRVRALGYPASGHPIQQGGQTRTLVLAGPFETRTAAEAARLKITQSIPGAPARLEQDASVGDAALPATAKPSVAAPARAGGWAVQLAAMSSRDDANALRDKLRAAGFDGFVDSVQSGGKQLWRVRAGPQTQRADAQRVHDQIKARLGLDGNLVTVP